MVLRLNGAVERSSSRLRDRRPSARQSYALAAALCERLGEEFPETGADASRVIERLRLQIGHPSPSLEETPLRPRRLPARRARRRLGRYGEFVIEPP